MFELTVFQAGFLLFAAHALADYPLQGQFMSTAKSRHSDAEKAMPGHWPFVLTGHAAIHGAFVGIITGLWMLAIAELVIHWITDFAKCEKWIGIKTDQFIHIGCKILWLAIFAYAGV